MSSMESTHTARRFRYARGVPRNHCTCALEEGKAMVVKVMVQRT